MNNKLPSREEIPIEQTWRLEDIYPDEALWEEELQEAGDLADQVKEYEGKLSGSAGNLYDALRLYDDCLLKLDRVGGYSFLRHDQDAGNPHYQEMELKAQFRCSGAEGFVNWVTHTLQIEDTANYEGWDHEEYEFRIFDDPNDLYETIRQKNTETNNNARMVAGFAWDWSEDKNAAVDDVDIPARQGFANFKKAYFDRSHETSYMLFASQSRASHARSSLVPSENSNGIPRSRW